MSDSESLQSDVSLDEENEELIWKVFYRILDSDAAGAAPGPHVDASGEDPFDFSDLSDIEQAEPALVARYRQLREKDQRVLPDDEQRALLISSFSEEQMERFEAFRRMAINKAGVRKVCNGILGNTMPQNIAVVMAGLSKQLLSEIITLAFEVQERENKTQLILDIDEKKKRKRETIRKLASGDENLPTEPERKLEYLGDYKLPLTPDHIREAWRIFQTLGCGAFLSKWRTQGENDGKLFR
ncbi:histone-fold-containing protein [Metschnikowia bicuspidata]|uniref:Histone-fold-containing protein n=1 Tax=Metschnikowia bicuspidata TaxID=27322 RepID=A0A4P9Z6Y2_9ASCO|nr:histone-fold-containing protein [Metschnikowia bicuspidata]